MSTKAERIARAIGVYFLGAYTEARIGARGRTWAVDAAQEAASQWLDSEFAMVDAAVKARDDLWRDVNAVVLNAVLASKKEVDVDALLEVLERHS